MKKRVFPTTRILIFNIAFIIICTQLISGCALIDKTCQSTKKLFQGSSEDVAKPDMSSEGKQLSDVPPNITSSTSLKVETADGLEKSV
ncbi:MAG: hypothetical protein ACRC2T_20400, partial [Thermoguttaceae bacterium]